MSSETRTLSVQKKQNTPTTPNGSDLSSRSTSELKARLITTTAVRLSVWMPGRRTDLIRA
jgi:hypothetical protein